jgi:hypothetical protein
MSLISSVGSAAATLVARLDPDKSSRPLLGRVVDLAGGLLADRKPDALTARLSASATTAAKAGSASAAKKTAGAAKPASAAKAATAASSTAASGYATASGEDFAFLKDPRLSVEEKLFRFMATLAKRNDEEVLKKLEEMKGGTAAKATGTGTSGSASAPKKPAATSVWSALKALLPPLGLAAQVVGDAKLKSLVTQATGPVLAAAATAIGLPALAPLALQAGPGLAAAIVDGKVGGEASTSAGGGSTSSGSSPAAGATAGTAKNEQVQLMELQRLVDKQKEMFAMVSNVLRAQHDTRMAIIGNVR